MPIPKRLRECVAAAEQSGWKYRETTDGHPQLVPPPGTPDPIKAERLAPPVTFSKTPSDQRSDKNAVAQLRRLGVDVPRKGDPKPKGKRKR